MTDILRREMTTLGREVTTGTMTNASARRYEAWTSPGYPTPIYVHSPAYIHADGEKAVKDENASVSCSGADSQTGNPPTAGNPAIPFATQEWMFECLVEKSLEDLHSLIDDHHDAIIEMARDRFRKGFVRYGDRMYHWAPEQRLEETLQELADAAVYPTSGAIE